MACECVNQVTSKTLAHLQAEEPTSIFEDYNSFLGTGMQNTCLVEIGNSFSKATYSEIKIEHRFRKTNGALSVPKNKTINISHKFCPFCGVEY